MRLHAFFCVLSFVLLGAGVNKSPACDVLNQNFPYKGMIALRGGYINEAYSYSARIPKGLAGYGPSNLSPQHGFGIAPIGSPPPYLLVDGTKNTRDYHGVRQIALENLEYLREDATRIESWALVSTHLSYLSAPKLEAIFTCSGSSVRYVQVSLFALSPDRDNVYTLSLVCKETDLRTARKLFVELIKSWHYKKE